MLHIGKWKHVSKPVQDDSLFLWTHDLWHFQFSAIWSLVTGYSNISLWWITICHFLKFANGLFWLCCKVSHYAVLVDFVTEHYRSQRAKWHRRSWQRRRKKNLILDRCRYWPSRLRTTHKSLSTVATTKSCWVVSRLLTGNSVINYEYPNIPYFCQSSIISISRERD